ncbi:unnamed protein product [Linum tenue]|uniref:Uncharacterized protein n=1 Tax=Linum tenue TaxID=586396 RepID=A0AAV0L8F9_9ROSI|nr:unnamed protein product [Linum tenue]
MENGHDEEDEEGKLARKMTGLGLNTRVNETPVSTSSNMNVPNSHNDHHSNDSLFQVMKAVEAAEATIKQQVEENTRLRTELQRTMQELEKVKIGEPITQGSHSAHPWNERVHSPYEVYQSDFIGNPEDKVRSMNRNSAVDPSVVMAAHQGLKANSEDTSQGHVENHSERSHVNGRLKGSPDRHEPESSNLSQFSSPSPASVSPGRYQIEGDYEPQLNVPGHGSMQMAEVNNANSLLKQDFVLKVREHEEEIVQLRKRLADYSVKETQIRNEKYVLEKRIAYMRLAFDQQQQDLVDAASKALSYRQDIIEENIRLTYELQAAQQERSTFVTSLMPLLAEYSLQPPVPDAQSIVSNVRVLFRHLHEKLILTESKLKESQYQLAPWRSDASLSNVTLQSPAHSMGPGLVTTDKNGLELVPQPTYARANAAMTSSDVQAAADWDTPSHNQSGLGSGVPKNLEMDDAGRYSPLGSRNPAARDAPEQFEVTRGDSHAMQYSGDNSKQVTFRDSVSNSEMDDLEAEVQPSNREAQSNWGSGTPYTTTIDDPTSSYSPYLPPVLEEPSSSFSEAADDDPLPAIEGLQISGDAFPGRELQACGYSTNGTTSCNFEWVRHFEDGSVDYIDGAKQPNYLVTADDVDTYLAIEVQPLDDRKRKGELVKVFANENRKITCDVEMQNHIERTLSNGHVAYKVSLSTGYLDIWEPATIVIKRDSYSIKSSGPNGAVVSEKFSSKTSVTIPYGNPTEFIIVCATGGQHLLRTDNDAADVSCLRDVIVLTMRLFIIKAGEKRKGKKRGLFFNK